MISIIVAMSRNRAIGRGGRLPWHLPSDLKHFKEITMGRPLIMGRRTWESLPDEFRPLPGRANIVISRQLPKLAKGTVCRSLEEALELVRRCEESFIIGGGSIFKQAMTLMEVGRIYLTEVQINCQGEAHFPTILKDEWEASEPTTIQRGAGDEYPFRYVTYQRIG